MHDTSGLVASRYAEGQALLFLGVRGKGGFGGMLKAQLISHDTSGLVAVCGPPRSCCRPTAAFSR